jgi:hypothetical protein
MTQIRTLLSLIFGAIAAMRTAFVAVQSHRRAMTIFWISLLCLPTGVLRRLRHGATAYPCRQLSCAVLLSWC